MEPKFKEEYVYCEQGMVRLRYIDGEIDETKFVQWDDGDDEIDDRVWNGWWRTMRKIAHKDIHIMNEENEPKN